MRKTQSCLSRGKRGGGAALSLLLRSRVERSCPRFAEVIVARLPFHGSNIETVQELHRSKLLYGRDYPPNMSYHSHTVSGILHKDGTEWQKMN